MRQGRLVVTLRKPFDTTGCVAKVVRGLECLMSVLRVGMRCKLKIAYIEFCFIIPLAPASSLETFRIATVFADIGAAGKEANQTHGKKIQEGANC